MSKKQYPYSINELYKENINYIIPMYQRNYSWGKLEIEQLILDIEDGFKNNHNHNYYLGTLVVNQINSSKFEIIDGQQRFTTLLLLLFYLEREHKDLLGSRKTHAQLGFECREKSTNTLEHLRKHGVSGIIKKNEEENKNVELTIVDGYKELVKHLKPILEKECKKEFINYLLENIKILRITVPDGTDVNHYFEVMNNRGEQLEKHEVLKARLMEKVQSDPLAIYTIQRVWEACLDMNSYVQMGFNVEERNKIFGDDWRTLKATSFNKVSCFLKGKPNTSESKGAISLQDILYGEKVSIDNTHNKNRNDNARFESIIDFPNFLLQALRSYQKSVLKQSDELVSLTDKNLLDSFDKVLLRNPKNDNHVKQFIFHLFKCRYLFDHYVIKRETIGGQENWAIQELGKRTTSGQDSNDYWVSFNRQDSVDEEDLPKNILMLQAALHVSYPTRIYKYWLSGIFDYLVCNESKPCANEYFNYLRNMARAILGKRLLVSTGKGYEEILLEDLAKFQHYDVKHDEIVVKLKYTNDPHHFVFNYLDFLLWQDKQSKNFRFVQRNSIEHLQPQHPKNSSESENWGENVHQFGNLCLTFPNKNSTYRNDSPDEKTKYYSSDQNLSLRHQIMFWIVREKNWQVEDMFTHQRNMIQLLINDLNSSQST